MLKILIDMILTIICNSTVWELNIFMGVMIHLIY